MAALQNPLTWCWLALLVPLGFYGLCVVVALGGRL